MTNATIVERNNTNHADSTNYEKYCKNITLCNRTEITEAITQNTTNINNTSTHSINSTDVNNKSNDKIQTSGNKIPAKDTILKYVYKNGEKVESETKDKGHIRNQLKRRKRSIQDPLSPLPSKFQEPNLIVNYETSHGPPATAEWTPPLKSANIIKNINRADFEIVSRHGNTNNKEDDYANKEIKQGSIEVRNQNEDSRESTDREQYRHNENREDTSNESDESGEQDHYRKKQGNSAYRQNSAESYEDGTKGNDQYDNSNESSENYNNKKSEYKAPESDESVESSEANSYASNEQPHTESREYSKYNQATKPYLPLRRKETHGNHDSSSEDTSESSSETYVHSIKPHETKPLETYKTKSTEADNSKENEHKEYSTSDRHTQTHPKGNLDHNKPNHSGEYKEFSTENSSESSEKDTNFPADKVFRNDVSIPVTNRSSSPIQDIDLRDFSYERINVNENGKVVAAKDNSENIHTNPDVEIISPKIVSDKKSHDVLELVRNIHKPLNYSDKLTHINDGEVKPVVELNTEYDEDSSERNTKINSNIYDSLESNFNGKDFNERSENLLKEHKTIEKENVKQDYERIPLNYNHNQNSQIETSTNVPPAEEISKVEAPPTDDGPKQDIIVTKSEGSIDIAPEDVKYDEHLKIKFDDIQIKLPEIKLPDDILSFTKSNSPYNYDDNDEDQKSRYTGQDNESKNIKDNEKDDGDDEAIPFYYGYYDDDADKNQDYQKKNNDDEEDDEDDDLYEKFVRERFGKRGTFEKRSEKLQTRPLNPHLTQTVQNILKKTASIDEQAKKSGDPNAGYMWTLEYGENL